MRRLYAVLVILMVLLTLTPVELLVAPQAKASITAGYAPSVLNMPPIALQPVLSLPSSLIYASFISPTTFVASNYYVSAASGPIAAGVAWDGNTVVATVGEGVTLNLTQAFGDTGGNYQQSLQSGNIYYAILLPNSTAPALANFNPPQGTNFMETVSGGGVCLSVSPVRSFIFYMNPFIQIGVGCGWTSSSGVGTLKPETLSEGRVTFVSPIALAQVPSSSYWLLALEDPVAFYYAYINMSEPLDVPANVPGGFGLGATDVPQLSSLFTLFRWGNNFFENLPIGVWMVNYPFIIDMNTTPVVHYSQLWLSGMGWHKLRRSLLSRGSGNTLGNPVLYGYWPQCVSEPWHRHCYIALLIL